MQLGERDLALTNYSAADAIAVASANGARPNPEQLQLLEAAEHQLAILKTRVKWPQIDGYIE